jgi:hypothetical protein
MWTKNILNQLSLKSEDGRMKLQIITKQQRHDMLHALGHPKINLRWKPKTRLKKCYRNRYVTNCSNDSWELLVTKGLAGLHIPRENSDVQLSYYYVSEKGMELLQLLEKQEKVNNERTKIRR